MIAALITKNCNYKFIDGNFFLPFLTLSSTLLLLLLGRFRASNTGDAAAKDFLRDGDDIFDMIPCRSTLPLLLLTADFDKGDDNGAEEDFASDFVTIPTSVRSFPPVKCFNCLANTRFGINDVVSTSYLLSSLAKSSV